VFVGTAALLYDVAGLTQKWLRDLRVDQSSNGIAAPHSPNPVPLKVQRQNGSFIFDAAGWGDATVIVPWEIYRAYGDKDVLREQWTSMTAWVDFAARSAKERRHRKRVLASPQPSPHEVFIWDSGLQLGDWCQPGGTLSGLGDNSHIATAFLCHSAELVSRIAAILELGPASDRYRALAESVRQAWGTEFMSPDGVLLEDTQTAHVTPLCRWHSIARARIQALSDRASTGRRPRVRQRLA
jgi:alpha-L-rhamnosidase